MKKLHIADRDDEQVYTIVDRYAKYASLSIVSIKMSQIVLL